VRSKRRTKAESLSIVRVEEAEDKKEGKCEQPDGSQLKAGSAAQPHHTWRNVGSSYLPVAPSFCSVAAVSSRPATAIAAPPRPQEVLEGSVRHNNKGVAEEGSLSSITVTTCYQLPGLIGPTHPLVLEPCLAKSLQPWPCDTRYGSSTSVNTILAS